MKQTVIRSTDVVVPLFEEREALPKLVASLAAVIDELPRASVVFVDDGSSDGSAELAEQLLRERSELGAARRRSRVLRHARNQGLAAALRTAFQVCDADAVCWLDADLSYPVELLPRLIACLDRGADVATVSPWHPAGSADVVPLGARIAEVPATLRGRVDGRSSLRIVPGIAGQLRLLGAAARGQLAVDSRGRQDGQERLGDD